MPSQKILQFYPDSEPFDNHFHYRSVIGKVNYLATLTHPDMQYAVHSCAIFSTCPKQEHGYAVEYIAKHLKGTSKIGMLFHPKKNEAFKVYADSDFSGDWLKEYAEFDPATAKSRLGWIITYANCPILWASRVQ